MVARREVGILLFFGGIGSQRRSPLLADKAAPPKNPSCPERLFRLVSVQAATGTTEC
jgi:hypothetical protein